jgi:hypothetical protein
LTHSVISCGLKRDLGTKLGQYFKLSERPFSCSAPYGLLLPLGVAVHRVCTNSKMNCVSESKNLKLQVSVVVGVVDVVVVVFVGSVVVVVVVDVVVFVV